MAEQPTPEEIAQDYSHDVDEVIGHSVMNPETGMGKGVVSDAKVVRNGRGDKRTVFVCVNAPGDGSVLRDVSSVLDALEGGYELQMDPWADER